MRSFHRVDPYIHSLYLGYYASLGRVLAVKTNSTTAKSSALMFTAVFVGGAVGSLLREAFTVEILGLPTVSATFGINVVACFILGWLYAARHRVHAHVLHLGAVGFCGGLSTFSSFVSELDRIATHSVWAASSAAALEIVFGLIAALLGEAIGRRVHKMETPQ